MSIATLKAERIVDAGLRLLLREIVLPRLVWRDAAGDFKGAKNDTISIRVPSYAKARTRDLRSGAARTRDSLAERKVDVTLDTDVYKDLRITDEELSLDIASFSEQVMNPSMAGLALQLEQGLIDKMAAASYAKSIAFAYASDDAWKDLIVPAREKLNKARVPMAGRVLAVGSGIETAMLKTDLFVKANESGSTSALSDAEIGRKAGFQIVSIPGLDPDEAYAFHRTAYVMNQRAPMVPAGAPFGASQSFGGFALRAVQVLDPDTIEDILALDAWVGYNVVTDAGSFDADDRFEPSEAVPGAKIAVSGYDTTNDDINTSSAHGLAVDDPVVFTGLSDETDLKNGRQYFVFDVLDTDSFSVSETISGAQKDLTVTATGDVQKNGSDLLVRAVKITAS